jgi:hypothetical protein
MYVAEELEEPTYELLRDYGSFELRRYASSIQARVQTTGSGRRPSVGGFRRIAGYIFGGNNARTSIAMTAPVETWTEGGGEWMAFTMPSSYTLESLPAPVDAGVVLTECKGRDVAVLSFSGRFHQSKSEKLGKRLKGMVVEQGLTPTQEPILAVYDGPMTLPFKRRNEMLLPVERVSLD